MSALVTALILGALGVWVALAVRSVRRNKGSCGCGCGCGGCSGCGQKQK